MTQAEIYSTLKKFRKIQEVADKAQVHRNTIRNQFIGGRPISVKVLKAAEKILADIDRQQAKVQEVAARIAPTRL